MTRDANFSPNARKDVNVVIEVVLLDARVGPDALHQLVFGEEPS